MTKEHDSVVLAADLPEYSLQRGDIGTVVLVHQDDRGYEVEFITLEGETLAVLTLMSGQVRSIAPHEIAHVRMVAG